MLPRSDLLPIRIGLLTPEYPIDGMSPGGIGVYVRTLAHTLAEIGHSLAVLLTTRPRGFVANDGAAPVYGVDRERPANSPFPSQFSIGGFERSLADLSAKLDLQLLEAPEWGGLTAHHNKLRIPVVVRLHTCSAIIRSTNDQSGSLLRRIWHASTECRERRAIQSADAVTAISQASVALTRKLLGIRRDDFAIIPNPVLCEFYDRRWTVPAKPTIVFAGRLEWRKGPDRLVRAIPQILARCPEARFRFVGADTSTAPGRSSMLRYLQGLIPSALNDRVEFCGAVRHSAMPEMFSKATVCVFPSRWEGFGIVVAEAMACGTPVVVSDAPAFREILSDGVSGLAVPGDDAKALSIAVTRILQNASLAVALGEGGRSAAMRWHQKAVAEATAEVYQRLLRRHPRQDATASSASVIPSGKPPVS